MILLDTHIWVWWVDGDKRLKDWQIQIIKENENIALGLSAISCWEVAKLAEIGRVEFNCSVEEWMGKALAYPGIRIIELTPQIAIESTKLPGGFHKDPADQIIVATARTQNILLLTSDEKILSYQYVKTIKQLSEKVE